MPQIVEQNDIFGKIGGGFGKGLGALAGEQIDRYRLSKSLEKLNKGMDSGEYDTPAKAAGALLTFPGVSDRAFKTLAPIYERQARVGAINRMGIPDQQAQERPQQEVEPKQPKRAAGSLLNEGDTDVLLQEPRVFTAGDVIQRQNQILKQNPYLSDQEANQMAQSSLEKENTELSNKQASIMRKQAAEQNIRNSAIEKAKKVIQTTNLSDVYTSLPGRIQNNILDKAIDQYAGNAKAVEDKVANDMLQFTKVANTLNKMPDKVLGETSKDYSDKIKEIQKSYEKVGAQEEFKDILMNKGYGPGQASEIAYPLSPKMKQTVGKLRKQEISNDRKVEMNGKKVLNQWKNDVFDDVESRDLLNTEIGSEKLAALNTFVDDVAKNMTPDQSINALAYKASRAGFDDQSFYNLMQEKVDSGEFVPSDNQVRELQQKEKMNVGLIDIASSILRDLGSELTKHAGVLGLFLPQIQESKTSPGKLIKKYRGDQ